MTKPKNGSKQKLIGRRFLYAGTFLLLATLTFAGFVNCSPGAQTGDGGSNGGARVDPLTVYNNQVRPIFQSRCIPCHDIPVRGGSAPLTIYDYALARNFLAEGPAANNNTLMNKTQGLSHGGGNICSGGINQPPCQQILAWWSAEFGGASTSRYAGQVYYVSARGQVDGYAVDTTNTALQLTVHFYTGPIDTGTFIGTSVANIAGPAGGYPGAHIFSYNLPAAYRNGTTRTLYVYLRESDGDTILQGTPLTYTAYTPRAEAFFNSNVLPALNNQCGNCHTRGYLDSYNLLAEPLPSSGGTAVNNVLINKGSGASHSGGNACGGRNSGACLQMQEWWRREFQ